jgi:hypothetical protein
MPLIRPDGHLLPVGEGSERGGADNVAVVPPGCCAFPEALNPWSFSLWEKEQNEEGPTTWRSYGLTAAPSARLSIPGPSPFGRRCRGATDEGVGVGRRMPLIRPDGHLLPVGEGAERGGPGHLRGRHVSRCREINCSPINAGPPRRPRASAERASRTGSSRNGRSCRR